MRRSRAKWAASCTRSRCRLRRCSPCFAPRSAYIPREFALKGDAMTDNPAFDQIKKDITDNDVVLFMKGTPSFPQCGFSAAVVQVLNHLGVKFKGVNVLADDQVRNGIKQFSNWPTIPQLYVKGEFVGGCDIVREMAENGELQDFLKEKQVATA